MRSEWVYMVSEWVYMVSEWVYMMSECSECYVYARIWMVIVYGECWVNTGVIDCINMFVSSSMQIIMCDYIQHLYKSFWNKLSNCQTVLNDQPFHGLGLTTWTCLLFNMIVCIHSLNIRALIVLVVQSDWGWRVRKFRPDHKSSI